MGLVIGMDEAGYGPNLGPLVVTVTAWEVPGHPRETDFWTAMADVVDQSPSADSSRLHIADSKKVYKSSRGMVSLERAVLSALRLCGQSPAGFRELCQLLAEKSSWSPRAEPWFDGPDLPLPQAVHTQPIEELSRRWRACCHRRGIRLRAIRSDIVLTERFNRLTRDFGSKGVTLSRVSMRLLRQVWEPHEQEPVLIVADKHGGRNRYDRLLAEILDGQMIFRLQEGRDRSSYRVGATEIRFQKRAESFFTVALASMVSKYVRELAMTLFNHYWREHVRDLKPTKGYPVDARRFKRDIAEAQSRLGIDDELLWRER